jgi:purine nucleosidase
MIRILLALALACPVAAAGEPVRIIFDTDMGNDVDDALALALLHACESRGEARILAVTITKDNRWAATFVDLLDTFYGRPGIPVGMV